MTNLFVLDISKNDKAEMLELARQRGHFEVIEKFHAIGNATSAMHYLSGELLMRDVCKQQTGLEYHEQEFLHNEHGKPMLKNNADWHFNKSHSVNRVVLATSSAPVGVDVEKIRDARMNVASRYFSHDEINMLNNMPTKAQQDQLFYQLWTAREAYLKFLGTGISYGLTKFSIEKLCSGEFRVSDPKGVNCKLTLYPMNELYQLALCTQPEDEVVLSKAVI